MIDKNSKTTNVFKLVPWWGWVSGFAGLFFCWAFYQLSFLISSHCIPWNFCSKIDAIDNAIPFCPYFFAQIYVLSYIFWIISPIAMSACKRENFYDFIFSYASVLIIACIICAACPTYMNRLEEGLIDKVKNPGFSNWIMRWVYHFDGGNMAYNLCPSSHCYISILCWLGVFRKKGVRLGYRIFAPIMAWLIVLSTVFVKQHYFIDTICGIALSVLIYEIYHLTKVGQKFNLFIQKKKLERNKKKKES